MATLERNYTSTKVKVKTEFPEQRSTRNETAVVIEDVVVQGPDGLKRHVSRRKPVQPHQQSLLWNGVGDADCFNIPPNPEASIPNKKKEGRELILRLYSQIHACKLYHEENMARLEDDMASLQSRLQELTDANVVMKRQVSAQKRRVSRLSSEKQEVDQLVEILQTKMREEKAAHEEMETAYVTMIESNSELEDRIDALQRENSSLKRRCEELENTASNLQDEQASMLKRLRSEQTSSKELQARLDAEVRRKKEEEKEKLLLEKKRQEQEEAQRIQKEEEEKQKQLNRRKLTRSTKSVSRLKTMTLEQLLSACGLSAADLQRADLHAVNAPNQLTRSVTAIGDYLSQPFPDHPLLQLRAVYCWITRHIRYDNFSINNPSMRRSQEPQAVLNRLEGVCEGYSKLIKAFCQHLDITCEYVTGFSKGAGYEIGQSFVASAGGGHAWNAVKLQGAWFLLDATWDAGDVKDGKFHKKSSFVFFLMNPRHFILSHFPEKSDRWQLIDPYWTLDMFAECFKPSGSYFELGLELGMAFSQKNTIKMNGHFHFEMSHPRLATMRFMLDLKDMDGELIPGCTLLQQVGGKLIGDVYPPKKGQFSLFMYGKDAASTGTYPSLLEYRVINEGIDASVAPLRPFLGAIEKSTAEPGWRTLKDFGVVSCSHDGWMIKDERTLPTDTIDLRFKTEQPLDVMVTGVRVQDMSLDDPVIERDCGWFYTEGDTIVTRFRPFENTLTVMRVWMKMPNDGRQSFSDHALFVIDSRQVGFHCKKIPKPITYTSWLPHYQLVSPTEKALCQGESYSFQYVLPDVRNDVFLRHGNEYMKLEKQGDRVFLQGPLIVRDSVTISILKGNTYYGILCYECN